MFSYVVIFGKVITSYTILVLIGIFIVGIFGLHQAKKYQIDDNQVIVFFLIVACGVLIGSHFLYGIINIRGILKLTKKGISFVTFINQTFGGTVFYGGLFGGLLFGWIYIKKNGLNLVQYIYLFTPVIPLFHFFGRLGCFLSGCCFGIESKIGFVYQNALVELANGVRRFPVQLVEALCNLLLFMLLYYLQNKKYKTNLLHLYLFIYAIMRFFLEFLRGDSYRGSILCFSISQWISLFIILWIIGLLFVKKLKNHNV